MVGLGVVMETLDIFPENTPVLFTAPVGIHHPGEWYMAKLWGAFSSL